MYSLFIVAPIVCGGSMSGPCVLCSTENFIGPVKQFLA